jgi:hypothetical protein
VSEAEAIPDRDRLRSAAVAHTRQAVKRAAIVTVGLFVAFVAVVFVTLDDMRSRDGALAVVVALAVLGVAALVGFGVLRAQSRNPELLLSADSRTRRAVALALRTGHSDDARIDALARDSARRTLRRPWPVWGPAFLVLLEALVTVSQLISRDWWQALFFGIFTAGFAVQTARGVAELRRRRDYLRQGRPAQATDTAA